MELYIHIPFCVKKCNYCDFLSFPADSSVRESYIGKLNEELIAGAEACGALSVSSVYIGGGTPSILSLSLIESVMDTVRGHYHLLPNAEITIEANPASALSHKFAGYLSGGINRLSLGLQSADNGLLKGLGRAHSFEEFLKAYECARKEGFHNVNVDLINHIPGETYDSWKKTLKNVILLKPEHISVYELILEPGTPFYEMDKEGLLKLPDEETSALVDSSTRELMEKAGYIRYEFSNFARPGYECRHNIGYWTGEEYLGFGLGASSCFKGKRWKNISDLVSYMGIDFGDPSRALGALRREESTLTREDEMEEFMYLGLRLIRGISCAQFKARFGLVIENIFGVPLMRYTRLGLMEHKGDRYFLTDRGIDVSNRILADFLLH